MTPIRFGRNVALRDASLSQEESPAEDAAAPRIAFITLGCPKNQVDSEVMLGHLDQAGFRTAARVEDADVAVVNTCAFLASAIDESIETLIEVAEHKKTGRLRKVVVAGCLTQRYGEELLGEIPELDAVMGTSDIDRVVQVVSGLLGATPHLEATQDDPDLPGGDMQVRALSTGTVSPYLKISEGCSAHCTFCIIPQLRGPGRSREVENIVEEAARLASLGARELVLIAQDLTAYGRDLYGEPSLSRLLRALDEVDGIRWVRLMYANPFWWTEELIDTVAGSRKVVPYADMPIQHITDPMLKRMGRQTDRKTVETLIRSLRDRVPGISLRTNIIAGFPGETPEDFEALMEFLAETRFDKLVAFPYSAESGTAAERLGEHVPEEVKQERIHRILAQQGQISLEINRSQVGRLLDILVEEAETPGQPAIGRSVREAPEVDGRVRIAGTGLRPGEFYPVRITGADAYDLVGVAEAGAPEPMEIDR